MESSRISLSQAIKEGRLSDFVDQAERDGIGPADRGMFDAIVKRSTEPQPSDRTSRSPARGGSRGK